MRTHPYPWRTIDECVARLAPELDNSIAPLRTCLEILRLDRGADATVERERSRMQVHLAQLLTLADDLSAINAINQSRLRLVKSRVRLASVVGFALERVDPMLADTGRSLRVAVPPRPVWLDADHLLLGQALASLLLDAINCAPNTGRILLRAVPAGGEIEVTIERAQAADSVAGRSLRLGVTIARVIVEMHGGTLHASIPDSGNGDGLTLRLPLHPTGM